MKKALIYQLLMIVSLSLMAGFAWVGRYASKPRTGDLFAF